DCLNPGFLFLLQRARRANQIAEQLPDQIFRCLVRQVSGIAPHAMAMPRIRIGVLMIVSPLHNGGSLFHLLFNLHILSRRD
ncbi:MAG TPA: hypothetical protein VFX54_03825, partial [Candidatus Binatia bacterium]|nr:hypothetical protein [Candidatus Binatia bacterium]